MDAVKLGSGINFKDWLYTNKYNTILIQTSVDKGVSKYYEY